MPSEGLMVKYTWFMGPRTSSTLPIAVCFEIGQAEIPRKMSSEKTYLVFQVDRRIEVGDLWVRGLDHHLALTGMDKLAHL